MSVAFRPLICFAHGVTTMRLSFALGVDRVSAALATVETAGATMWRLENVRTRELFYFSRPAEPLS
jgi:hypothetical protein